MVGLRQIERALIGIDTSVEGNLTKLLAAEFSQRVAECAIDLLGPAAATTESKWLREYFYSRSLTIGGGTAEITRNVIAERILGLPRGMVKN